MRFRFQFLHVYLAAGLLIAIAAIAIVTGLAATRQNNQSIATQKIIARFETQEAYQYLQGQIRQMVYWQDAFEKISRKWDEQWVAYQFGPYQDSMGNHLVAIVSPNRELRFLHATESNFTRQSLLNAKGLDALLNRTSKAGLHLPPPIPQGIIVVGGKPYFAVAAFVTPEEEKDVVFARQHPLIVIFFKPVTTAQYEGFAAGFGTNHLHIALSDHALPGCVQFALNDAEGRPLAWLEWRPHLPGGAFLRSVALPLSAVLLILMLIQVRVIQRWLALQRHLISTKAETAAAQEQNRLKTVFLGTISHELRTPLNAIIGYSDVLCCKLFGPLGSPRNTEYVQDIRDSGRRLLKTVNDLIEITRIEAQDSTINDEWFDVAVAARQAVTSLEHRAKEKNITVLLAAPNDEAWCNGSRPSLAHALERILSNAIRHSREGGRVDVKVEQTTAEVLVEVRDYGEGIPQERLADLSRPFGHAENHLIANGKKGMGFGIPIAKGLVQLMGGTFTIESQPEIGTVVRIRFPAQTPELLPAQTAGAPDVVAPRHHSPAQKLAS